MPYEILELPLLSFNLICKTPCSFEYHWRWSSAVEKDEEGEGEQQGERGPTGSGVAVSQVFGAGTVAPGCFGQTCQTNNIILYKGVEVFPMVYALKKEVKYKSKDDEIFHGPIRC